MKKNTPLLCLIALVMLSFLFVSVNTIETVFAETSSNVSSFFNTLNFSTTENVMVMDCLDDENSYEFTPGTSYNFEGTFENANGVKYLRVRVGGLDINGDLCANGLDVNGLPGGGFVVGDIKNDFFDKLVSYIPAPNTKYGNNKEFNIANDGIYVFQISDKLVQNSVIKFMFTITLDNDYYNNSKEIKNAISVELLDLEQNSLVEKDIDMTFKEKSNIAISMSTLSSIQLNKNSLVNFNINSSGALYNEYSFDFIMPKAAELKDFGFNSKTFTKTHDSYGEVTVNVTESGENKVYHFTVSNGYKPQNTNPYVYLNIFLSSDNFEIGKKYNLVLMNRKLKYIDNDTEFIIDNKSAQTTSITAIDPSKDSTSVQATNITEFNPVSQYANIDYMTQMGAVWLKNIVYNPLNKKTIEVTYNKTLTAAKITAVSLPIGDEVKPFTFTGLDKSGNLVEVVVSDFSTIQMLSISYQSVSSSGYLFFASKLGLEEIRSVKAPVGALGEGFATTGWLANKNLDSSLLAAYGKFTTGEDGIEVINEYHVYSDDLAYRESANGDLYCKSTATSTLTNNLPLQTSYATYQGVDENGKKTTLSNNDTTAPGNSIKFTEYVGCSSYSSSFYTSNGKINANGIYINSTFTGREDGNAYVMVDPELYLCLPKGFELENYLFKVRYRTMTSYAQTETIAIANEDIKVENVTYLNKVDDTSLFRIRLPEGTFIGYCDGKGRAVDLYMEITLATAKSIPTGTYIYNDLIQIKSKGGSNGCVQGDAVGGANNLRPDKYGINDGNYMIGISKGATEARINLQTLAEIQVVNSICVSKIGGKEVPTKEWYSYSSNDKNSIALLGMRSEGTLKLDVINGGEVASKKVDIIVPIPKKGSFLGTMFMDDPFAYSMNITWGEEDIPEGYIIKKIVLDEAANTIGEYVYHDAENDEEANAILITKDSVPAKVTEEIKLRFSIDNGQAEDLNIFRTAHSYDSDLGIQNRLGNYVAAEIAGGTISGTAFFDENRNGQHDNEEKGLAGITVVITDEKGNVQVLETDENGNYEFLAIRESNVIISFVTDKNNEELSQYRYNVPSSDVQNADDGLSSTKEYPTLKEETKLNIALSTYLTLHYEANGGKGKLPANVECSEEAVVSVEKNSDNLKKDYYKFVCWCTTADGTGDRYLPGSSIRVNTDVCDEDRMLTLYAIWELATYEVTFNFMGGITTQEVLSFTIDNYSKKINDCFKEVSGYDIPLTSTAAYAPTKAGYVFSGFSVNQAGTSMISTTTLMSNKSLTSDFTLYAVWKALTNYNVSYETNTTETTYDSLTNIAWDKMIIPMTEPTKEGYTFIGWKYNNEMLETYAIYGRVVGDPTITNITITAVFEALTGFRVIYEGSADLNKEIAWNDLLYPNGSPTKEGMIFQGWSLTEDGAVLDFTTKRSDLYTTYGDTYSSENDEITLYPIFETIGAEEVVVKYETNGGTIYGDQAFSEDSDNLIPTTNPEKAGYTFVNWTYGDVVVDSTTVYNILTTEKILILTANYTVKSYTIQYSGIEITIEDKIVSYVDTGLLPTENVNKPGNEFKGFYYGDKLVSDTDSVSTLLSEDTVDTLILNAVYKEINYEVYYDSQGGGYITPRNGFKYDSIGLLPTSTPSKLGYSCVGWEYNGVTITSETSISSLNLDGNIVTFTAKYEEKTGFTVKYDSNGGSVIADLTNVAFNQSNLIPAELPTRKGYEFIGFICGRFDVDENTKYSDLTNTDKENTSVTFIAQWTSEKIDIKYYEDDEEYVWPDDVSYATKYTYGEVQNISQPYREGYKFIGWYTEKEFINIKNQLGIDEDTSAGVINLYICFKKLYTVDLSINNENAATMNGGNIYVDGDNVELSYEINYGYHFDGWYINDEKVSSNETYSFVVVDDIAVAAKFEKNSYMVTISETFEGAGVETGAGDYLYLENATLTVENNYGYYFTGWYIDDVKVSEEYTYVLEVTKDTSVEAKFEKERYMIFVNINDSNAGRVEGTQEYSYLDKAPLTATLNYGYVFTGWYVDGVKVADGLTDEIEVTDNTTVVAVFEKALYKVTLISNIENAGVETGAVEYPYLDTVRLETTVNYGYNFVGWYIDETLVSEETTYEFNIEAATTVNAKYGKNTYTVTVNINIDEAGSVSEGSDCLYLDELQLVATENKAYHFVGWYVGDELISKELEYNLIVVANTYVEGRFAKNTYNIDITAEEGGDVEGYEGGIVYEDDSMILTFKPKDQYHIVDVIIDGESLGPITQYELNNIAENHEIVVKFEKDNKISIWIIVASLLAATSIFYVLARIRRKKTMKGNYQQIVE